MALFIAGQFRLDDFVEGLIGGHQVFQAVGHPLHRPAQFPGKYADQNFLSIQRRLAAEAPAHVRRHNPNSVAGQIQNLDQGIADDARHLRSRMQGKGPAPLIVFCQVAPVLHGSRGLAVHAKITADTDGRICHGLVHIPAGKGAGDDHVGASIFMQQGTAGFYHGQWIDGSAQGFVGYGDLFHRIFCQIPALRHHGGHGLAHMAHLVPR